MTPYHSEINLKDSLGRLFVVGDIHGRLKEFKLLLETIDFDYSKDVLVFVGDLFDRGKENYELFLFLKPYLLPDRLLTHTPFYTTWGNHEEIILHALSGDPLYGDVWMRNKGEWYDTLTEQQAKDFELGIRYLSMRSPVVCTILYHERRYGICHAEVPCDDWSIFTSGIKYRYDALWGRLNIRGKRDFRTIKNIDKTFHGHTPYQKHAKKPIVIGNQYWLDGGSKCFICKEIKPNGKLIDWTLI